MNRFWEVDALRGLAVLSMVAFNWLFALNFLGVAPFDAALPANRLWALATVAAFVAIAGLSMHLAKLQGKDGVARGMKIFLLGLAVTAVTFWFIPEAFVSFGVLHLIGFSIILASLLAAGLPAASLFFLSLAVIVLGFASAGAVVETPWLFWLGFPPQGFQSVDYEPLIPWFGVFLFGLAVGKAAFNKKSRPSPAPLLAKPLCFLGRHSLAIYLLHQPLLVAALCFSGTACV